MTSRASMVRVMTMKAMASSRTWKRARSLVATNRILKLRLKPTRSRRSERRTRNGKKSSSYDSKKKTEKVS